MVIHGHFPFYFDEDDTRFYLEQIPSTFTNVILVPLNLISNLRTAVLGTEHHAFHMNNLQSYLDEYLASIVALHIQRSRRDRKGIACYSCDTVTDTFLYRCAFNFNGYVRDYAQMAETLRAAFCEGYFYRPEIFGETAAKYMIEKNLFPMDFLSLEVIPSCPPVDDPDAARVPEYFIPTPKTACSHGDRQIQLPRSMKVSEMMNGWVEGLRSYVIGKFTHSGFGIINRDWEIFEGREFINERFKIWEDCDRMGSLLGSRRCENFCGKEGRPIYKCDDCEMVW